MILTFSVSLDVYAMPVYNDEVNSLLFAAINKSISMNKSQTKVSSEEDDIVSSILADGVVANGNAYDNISVLSDILGVKMVEPIKDGHDDEIEDLLKDGVKNTEYAYLKTNGNVSQDQYDMLVNYLKIIDSEYPGITRSFQNNGWTLILTSDSLEDTIFRSEVFGEGEDVQGCTVFNKKEIFIEAGEGSYCVAHEFGHYVDYLDNFISETWGFGSLYTMEGNNLTYYGAEYGVSEYFAESVMFLIYDRATLNNRCPLTSAYVSDVLSHYK